MDEVEIKEKPGLTWKPLLLSLAILLADQISKAVVVAKIPLYYGKINIIGEFLTFIHVRNTGVAFSRGTELPEAVKTILFIGLPAILMLVLAYLILQTRRRLWLTDLQTLSLALILGGGTGNLVDRIFRPEGVVDFISVKLYGFLGMEYWPTFNIGDSAVVVGVILLIITFFLKEQAPNSIFADSKKEKEDGNE